MLLTEPFQIRATPRSSLLMNLKKMMRFVSGTEFWEIPVAGPHGHSNAPLPSQPRDGDDGNGKDDGFCNMAQSLEGMIPMSDITEDNDPYSEILSNDSFAKSEGGYLAPTFQRTLKVSKLGAPGILICRYFHTS